MTTHDGHEIVRGINGWYVADGSQCDQPQHSSAEAAADWWLEIQTLEAFGAVTRTTTTEFAR